MLAEVQQMGILSKEVWKHYPTCLLQQPDHGPSSQEIFHEISISYCGMMRHIGHWQIEMSAWIKYKILWKAQTALSPFSANFPDITCNNNHLRLQPLNTPPYILQPNTARISHFVKKELETTRQKIFDAPLTQLKTLAHLFLFQLKDFPLNFLAFYAIAQSAYCPNRQPYS